MERKYVTEMEHGIWVENALSPGYYNIRETNENIQNRTEILTLRSPGYWQHISNTHVVILY